MRLNRLIFGEYFNPSSLSTQMSLQHLQCIVKQKSPKILEFSHFFLVFLPYACSALKTHQRYDSIPKTLKFKGFSRVELLCALQMQTPSIAKAVHCFRTGEGGTFPEEGCAVAEKINQGEQK